MTHIGSPIEEPDVIVEPLYDPVPKTNPTPIPEEPTPAAPVKEPKREKVPA